MRRAGGEEIERNGEMITVPYGYFYVLGDNTADSYDSRYWKEPFVEEVDVRARVLGGMRIASQA